MACTSGCGTSPKSGTTGETQQQSDADQGVVAVDPSPVDHVVLTHDELSLEAIVRTVSSPTCGGTATFIGTTRNTFHNRQVVRLEYEAYTTMARRSLLKICDEIRKQWRGVHGIALVHRLGVVAVGEASVIIVITSPHRRDALDAVTFAIDTLKARVPIWKKENYVEGDSEWKANCEGCKLRST